MWNLVLLMGWMGAAVVLVASSEECRLIEKVPPDPDKAQLLDRLSPIKGTIHSCSSGGYTYAVSVCGGGVVLRGDNTSAAAVRIADTKSDNSTTIIGRYNATDIAFDGDRLTLVYLDGDRVQEGHCNGSRWSSIVIFICDPTINNAELSLLDGSLGGCWATFSLKTRGVCPQIEPMGKVTVIFVLLVTALMCYLVVGFAYRRIMVGAKGIEQIPNYPFWCSVCSFFSGVVQRVQDWCSGRVRERRKASTRSSGGGGPQYSAPDDPLLL